MIRKGSLVAAGTVVREGQEVGPGKLVAGVPAGVKRTLTPEEKNSIRRAIQIYLDLAAAHMQLAGRRS
jgi:carbonic anhydrase/acetyltransferase-like protein (isoleucine patch superfamily)